MKKIFVPFLSALLLVSVTLPLSASALDLIPCGNESDPNAAATSCDFQDFVVLVKNVINFMTIISIPIATGILVYVGIKVLTAQGNVKTIQNAKAIGWNVIMGFIVILSAWAIVRLIANRLLKPEYNQFLG